jgi:predicted pyridoxine 5'-phosphate oxidase superfamily flavin-nucleotide-binding protein
MDDGGHRRSPPVPRRRRHLLPCHSPAPTAAPTSSTAAAARLSQVLAPNTLAFADFAGNRQYITLGHLKENDRAHIFILHFATQQRVKLWGRARVIEDDLELMERLVDPTYKAKPPRAIVFALEAWDANCRQHITAALQRGRDGARGEQADRPHQGTRGRGRAAEGRRS